MSRLFYHANELERTEFMPKHVTEDDDFILAVETRSQKRASLMRSDVGAVPSSGLVDSPTAMSTDNQTATQQLLPPQTSPRSTSDEDNTELGRNSEICVDSPAELVGRDAV